MSAATYRLLAWAIENWAPLFCTYDGYPREICPIILGESGGREVALVYQIGGRTSSGPLQKPEWKCFQLSKLHDLARSDSEWQAGQSHRQGQSCVQRVDYDVNEASPYRPSRSLGGLRGAPSPFAQ